MTWLVVIIVVALICGAIGYFSSDEGERTEGALGGCLAGGAGCGYLIFQILLALLGLFILFRLGAWLFG